MAMEAETAKYMLALHDQIEALWDNLEHHGNAAEYRERAREYREEAARISEQVKEYRSDFLTSIRQTHEETAKYVNVVSVIGYAGYFTTWSFVKDTLGNDLNAFVGLMGLISVSVFVLWEMFAISIRLNTITGLSNMFRNMVSVQDFEHLRNEQLAREAKAIMVLNPIHKIVFFVSVVSALAGGSIMMHALYMSL